MRLVLVEPISVRGEGLGNEAIGWAKGFLASQVLHAALVGPAWGLNPRAYWRNFRSNRLDVFRNMLLRGIPHVRFTEADYWATGCIDFGHAIDTWARHKGLDRRRHWMITVGGMYGGYRCIRRAATFLRARLLASKDVPENVERVTRLLECHKLWVAVHVRLGDFAGHSPADQRGQFNFRLPLDWYASACSAVRTEFGGDVQFMFFSDQRSPAIAELSRQFDAVIMPPAKLTECSDVILMAEADLRICSVSSYSLLACFLSNGPYLWYEPQLLLDGVEYRIWKDPAATDNGAAAPIAESAALEALGHVHATGASLSRSLTAQLRRRLAARASGRNLIEYGSISSVVI